MKKALFLLPLGNANFPNYFCLRFSFIRKIPVLYLRFSFITNWASLQIISMDFIQFLVSLLCRQRRLGKLQINLSRQIQDISRIYEPAVLNSNMFRRHGFPLPLHSCGVKSVFFPHPTNNANSQKFFHSRFSFIRKMHLFYSRFNSFMHNVVKSSYIL